MKRYEEHHLDQVFKQLDDHITWDKSRQDQIRQSMLETIDIKENQQSLNNRRFKKVIPLLAVLLCIGIGSTLFLSHGNQPEPLSKPETHPNSTSGTKDVNYNNIQDIFTIEQEEHVKEIKDAGFDLRLPTHIPVNHIQMNGLVLRDNSVSAYFYQNEERVVGFVQESIEGMDLDSSDGLQKIKEESTDVTTINDHTTYIRVFDYGRIQLNIITQNYAFLLWSDQLTEDELIQVATSIDISGL